MEKVWSIHCALMLWMEQLQILIKYFFWTIFDEISSRIWFPNIKGNIVLKTIFHLCPCATHLFIFSLQEFLIWAGINETINCEVFNMYVIFGPPWKLFRKTINLHFLHYFIYTFLRLKKINIAHKFKYTSKMFHMLTCYFPIIQI
jgi:hypothetical protein